MSKDNFLERRRTTCLLVDQGKGKTARVRKDAYDVESLRGIDGNDVKAGRCICNRRSKSQAATRKDDDPVAELGDV